MTNGVPGLLPTIADDELSLFEIPNGTGSPERRLILAVLERAILDYVGNDEREIEEAEKWLFGEADTPTNAEFTFPWVCQELDLDSKTIAGYIKAMPKRGTRKIAPWYFKDEVKEASKPEKPCKVMQGNFPRYH